METEPKKELTPAQHFDAMKESVRNIQKLAAELETLIEDFKRNPFKLNFPAPGNVKATDLKITNEKVLEKIEKTIRDKQL